MIELPVLFCHHSIFLVLSGVPKHLIFTTFFVFQFYIFSRTNNKYMFISNFYYYVSMCPVSVAMDTRYEKLAFLPVGDLPVSHAH